MSRTRYIVRVHDESRPTYVELPSHPRGTRLLSVVVVCEEDDERALSLALDVVRGWSAWDVASGGTGAGTATLLALDLDIAWLDELRDGDCWRVVCAWNLAEDEPTVAGVFSRACASCGWWQRRATDDGRCVVCGSKATT